MIEFTVGNSLTRANTDSDGDALIDSVLRYKVPSYEIIKRKMGYAAMRWDGTKSFYSRGIFLTGLLGKVTAKCVEAGMPFSISDKRPEVFHPGTVSANMLQGIELYDFQVRTINECLHAKRGVVQLPTGAGKTEVAIALTKAIMQPTLFITHRVNLLHQTAQRYTDRLPELKSRIGVIGDGGYQTNFLTFATVQTLYSFIKKDPKAMHEELSRFKVLITDEAHHSGAMQFYESSKLCTGATWRFALTATPFMGGDVADDMYLMGTTGPVISRVTNSELIDAGILAKPYFKFFEISEPAKIKSLKSWRDVYERGIVHNTHRKMLIARQTAHLS
jgi:superfamily II DNA or RNA helicase